MSESTSDFKESLSDNGEGLQGQRHPALPVNPSGETPDEPPAPPKRRQRRKRFIRFMSGGDASAQSETEMLPEQTPTPPMAEQKTEPEKERKKPSDADAEIAEEMRIELEKNTDEVVEPRVAEEVGGEQEETVEEVIETEAATDVTAEQEEAEEKSTEVNVKINDPHVNLRMRGPPVMDHTWSRATELSGPPRDPLGLGWILESPNSTHSIEKPRGAPINPLRPYERRGPPDPLVEWLCEDDTLTRAVDAVQGLLQGLNAPTSEEE